MEPGFSLCCAGIENEIVALLVSSRRLAERRPLQYCHQPSVFGGFDAATNGDDVAKRVFEFYRNRRFQDRALCSRGGVVQVCCHNVGERYFTSWAQHALQAQCIEEPLQAGGFALRVVGPENVEAGVECNIGAKRTGTGLGPEPQMSNAERHSNCSIRIVLSIAPSVAWRATASMKAFSSTIRDSVEEIFSNV